MQAILIIVLAIAAGVPLGFWLRRNLATLGYRSDDEADLPEPGPRWWVVWASILAIGSLAIAAALRNNPLDALPLLPVAVVGPWLAAVDFDVLRIPNRVLFPTAAATLVNVVVVAASTQDLRALIAPIATALVTGGVFAAVHFATNGGIGFGDVKLVVVTGLAVGSRGGGATWFSVIMGSLAALAWANLGHRDRPIPYGPWLLCGTSMAAIAQVIGVA